MPRFETLSVDRSDELRRAVVTQDYIGLDTEFMREKTYFAQLCLIQLALGTDLYCVDPLQATTPESFWPDLMRPAWVLHSGRQDLEVVSQSAERLPGAVFDTQIAAALLGYPPQMGYANLVAELYDVQLAKSHTRADWSRRPLPEAALAYAAEDVEHLLPAWQLLSERLADAGRLEWAFEDCADLLDPALYRIDADNAIERVKGARGLQGRARRAAVGLATWREQQAVSNNRPRQWILRDAVLLHIAGSDPGDLAALGAVPGLPAATVQRAGDALLSLLEAARGGRDDYVPPPRPDDQQKAAQRALQKVVARCADELGIAAEVIAPRKELVAAVAGERDLRVFRGWRCELIGNDLLERL